MVSFYFWWSSLVGRPVVIVRSAKKFLNYFGALELWRTPLASIFIFFGWASTSSVVQVNPFFFLSPTISTRWCADRKQDRKWNLEEEEECWRQKSEKGKLRRGKTADRDAIQKCLGGEKSAARHSDVSASWWPFGERIPPSPPPPSFKAMEWPLFVHQSPWGDFFLVCNVIGHLVSHPMWAESGLKTHP